MPEESQLAPHIEKRPPQAKHRRRERLGILAIIAGLRHRAVAGPPVPPSNG